VPIGVVTGANLRDIDEDGYLVEEVDEKEVECEDRILAILEEERSQRAEASAELGALKRDVSEIKEYMRQMALQQPNTKNSTA